MGVERRQVVRDRGRGHPGSQYQTGDKGWQELATRGHLFPGRRDCSQTGLLLAGAGEREKRESARARESHVKGARRVAPRPGRGAGTT